MTANEILTERLNRIDTIPGRFIAAVSASQMELFAELIEVLSQLGQTNGNVVLTAQNLALVDSLMLEYYERLKAGRYGSLVAGFLEQMTVQGRLIETFATLEYNAVVSASSEAVFLESRKQAVRQLLGDDFKTNFVNVIRDQVVSSVENQTGFKSLVESLRPSFVNGEVNGQIVNWTNQIASDRFAMADRAYSNAIGAQLDLQFGQYVGGLITDSREFCVERNDRFYHINEVEDWAKLEWQGKFRRTTKENIITVLGGYRCQHLFVLRSLINVPRIDIERNIANGNYTPSNAEKTLLNL